MKSKILFYIAVGLAFLTVSCDSYLDKEPDDMQTIEWLEDLVVNETMKLVEDLRLQVEFYLQVPPARKMHVLLKE